MTAGALMAVCEGLLRSSPHVVVSRGVGNIVVFFAQVSVITLTPRGAGVVVRLSRWLGARPSQSLKLQHIETGESDTEGLYTESEWHLRGILGKSLDRIAQRTTLSDRLDATLAGRVDLISSTPEEAGYWRAVAKWGKESDLISSFDRMFAWKYADLLERKLPPSQKFRQWAEKKAIEVRRAGFEPPTTQIIRDDP